MRGFSGQSRDERLQTPRGPVRWNISSSARNSQQVAGVDCTNCKICHDACNEALGQGNAVLHLNDPEPNQD